MKAKASNIAVFALLAALVLGFEAEVAMAVTCNPAELSPCLNAITLGSPPTSLCCSRIKEQTPCLCQYARNPSLQPYVNSSNAKKVVTTCGVSIPKC